MIKPIATIDVPCLEVKPGDKLVNVTSVDTVVGARKLQKGLVAIAVYEKSGAYHEHVMLNTSVVKIKAVA